MQRLPRTGLLLAIALFAGAASAATFTLADLVENNATFQSDNGLLTFSDFEVKKLKRLGSNLSQYTITTTADGFLLTSPNFTANSGGLRKLDLSYTVTANRGLITGASMVMEATRQTGRVKVEKDIESPTGDEGTFLLTLLRNNASLLSDSDTFSPGETRFDVEESIRIKKVSALTSIRNAYTVTVSEPAEAALLLAGLVGLAFYGRRSRASA
jgi:hypothetical protein